MTIQVYTISGSPFGWRALLALAVKDVPHEIKVLETSKKEQKEDWYLKLNPLGTVPILVDGEDVVRDSIPILVYLDRKHPRVPFFGDTPIVSARIWEKIGDLENSVWPTLSAITRPILRQKLPDDLSDIREQVEESWACLEDINVHLSKSTYLCGDVISAADILLMPMVQVWLRAAQRDSQSDRPLGLSSLEGRCADLWQWSKSIEAIPGYDATYPNHWK